jgi:hypothetical protein
MSTVAHVMWLLHIMIRSMAALSFMCHNLYLAGARIAIGTRMQRVRLPSQCPHGGAGMRNNRWAAHSLSDFVRALGH